MLVADCNSKRLMTTVVSKLGRYCDSLIVATWPDGVDTRVWEVDGATAVTSVVSLHGSLRASDCSSSPPPHTLSP